MVGTTTELVPLLASLFVAAPGWAFEPCAAIAGDTLRCGTQVVRVRGIEAAPLDTDAGVQALERLQRRMMSGRVRIEPVAVDLSSGRSSATARRSAASTAGNPSPARAAGPVLVANVYVSEVRITQRHVGELPAVDITECDVVGANSLRCGTELLLVRGVSSGKSAAALARVRAWLQNILQSSEVKFVRLARDHYGRIPVDLYVDGERVRCNSRRVC